MDASSRYCPSCGALQAAAARTCLACGKPMSESPAETLSPPARTLSGQLPPQHLLEGRFRILQRIGTGGFAAVYRGEDTQAGNRRVAIKEMSQAGLSPQDLEEATGAFHREAELLRELEHPGLPRIHAHFREGGHWYLVMDFIEGETLEERLARAGGRLPLKEVFALGIQLSQVLEYLHMRQLPVIFRDLKPSNVLLTPEHRVCLIDFGIARHFTPGKRHDTVAFGSPGYAAPEQYGSAQTTPRSDIFSLGALLHQLLTGADPSEQPFHFAPVTLPTPAGLADLIAEMVDLDAAERPASMAAVRAVLERERDAWQHKQAQASTAISAVPALASTLPAATPRRTRGWWPRAIAVVVALVILGVCAALNTPQGTTGQDTTAVGITDVTIGAGDPEDPNSGIILYETTTFSTDDVLTLNFTVTTHDANSEVEFQLLDQGNQLPPRSGSVQPQGGTTRWYAVFKELSPGTFTVELQYNHATEYTNTITVIPSGTATPTRT